MESIIIDKRELDILFASIPKLAKQSQDEQLKLLVRRFTTQAYQHTPPLLKTKGWAGTRQAHKDFFAKRKEMRLPRGDLPWSMLKSGAWRDKHLSKSQAEDFYKVAEKRQGELLSGWNAAAEWSGLKNTRVYQKWIRRHGKMHGALSWSSGWSDSRAIVRFFDNSKNQKTDIRKFAIWAKNRALWGLQQEAEHILEKRLARELKKRGIKQ